jgi:hypothetical protein
VEKRFQRSAGAPKRREVVVKVETWKREFHSAAQLAGQMVNGKGMVHIADAGQSRGDVCPGFETKSKRG